MKVSQLKNLFSQNISFHEFKKNVSQEFTEFHANLNKRGGSSPIYLVEDTVINVGFEEAIFLIDAFLNDTIFDYELQYIVDALLLSESVIFCNENLIDFFETLTDPSINGDLTKDKAQKIKQDITT